MASLTLLVMAAGIGSRYGGLKQIDPVGPNGEIVVDYSVYDALWAGFDKVVFVIRREIEGAFRERIGRTVESRVETAYVFQELDRLPTGHAILCARDSVVTPFAAINADDFYGRTAFAALAEHLRNAGDSGGIYDYAMVGYVLENTLSEHGHVARGVCEAGADGCLVDIRERKRVRSSPDGVKFAGDDGAWVGLPAGSFVSMNIWGFTPSLFGELEARFPAFLRDSAAEILKAEFLIPEVVGSLVRKGKARVRVLPTAEKWFGVTYPEDRPRVQAAIREIVARGIYPEDLWEA
jgi:hypothetical protein